METRCRSAHCDAPIKWLRTASGKRIPVDAEPNSDGNVQLAWVGGEQVAIVLNAADRAAAQVDGCELYMPHHATCPDVGRWR